ncbi:MAG: hypothetical protein GY943_30400 [Chloroflexi bacterium]|nr:hypothetical protein [Chloroflexota bacterium]
MKVCTAKLKSITPYSQSRQHDTEKLEKETHEAYEKRTWINKAHVGDNGKIYIPPMAFKQAVDAAAKYLSIQIPGKGKATYTKHFLSGLLVMDKMDTGVEGATVEGEWINCNSDGVRGSGKRVKRCFPLIPSWEGKQDFYILDETIDETTFERVLKEAGALIGIGRFRPQNGGFYGRFSIEGTKWRDE